MLRALIVVALMGLPTAARAQSATTPSNDCSFRNDIPARNESIPGRPGASHFVVAGNVVITCGKDLKVYADELDGETDRDLVTLRGNVVLEKEGLNIYAEHAVFNRKTRTGTFYNVHGTAQTSMNTIDKDQFGGMEPDMAFWASEVSKTGENLLIKYTLDFQGTPIPVALTLTPKEGKMNFAIDFADGQFQLAGEATKQQ